MTNRTAARVLSALAMRDPEYEALSAEYAAVLSDNGALSGVPDDFALQTLDLLRANPDTAAEVARCERNVAATQTYGLAETQQVLLIVAAMILLLRPHVDFSVTWDWKFLQGALKVDTTAVDEKTLKTVLSVLSVAAKKASEGLDGVSKALDGHEDNDT